MKRALITGITGQDGSYLADILLEKGYEVHGIVRRTSSVNTQRTDHLKNLVRLHDGDLIDLSSLISIMNIVKPDEIYNLAAQSFVPTSWKEPTYTGDVTALGVTRILEAMKLCCPESRFYQASSSEMFGKARFCPQNELTAFYPRSPYGVAKTYGHYITINYRESYNMYACCGICFNHESPRRGIEFVTQKIAYGVANIYLGKEKVLKLGNLDASRDWGFAKDYMEAAYMMLQMDSPDDYVISTGITHRVKDFVEEAFSTVGLDWKNHIEIDKSFLRPAEVDILVGDSSKARDKLGWTPKTNFSELVKMMVEEAIKVCSK